MIRHATISHQSDADAAVAVPLADGVRDAILGRIRADGLKAGDALPSELALAAELGVSRPVVREAFRSLAALSLIELHNGRRARVRVPDGDVLGILVDHAVRTEHVSIQQIFDVRRTIEMRTVELAALRRSAEECAGIARLVDAMEADLARPERLMEHDIAFHLAIAGASRNPMFDLVMRSFEAVTRQTWPISWAARRREGERETTIGLHRAVADAIAAGDPGGAATAMADHFDNSSRALRAAGLH